MYTDIRLPFDTIITEQEALQFGECTSIEHVVDAKKSQVKLVGK